MRKTDLQNLALAKLEAAQILADNRRWSNAYYLAGYCIEFALKACIAKLFSADTIPDKNLVLKVHTHDLRTLLGLAGLKADFDAALKEDNLLAANWAICSEWSPESRYQDKSAAEAIYLLGAATSKEHGVLEWIRMYW